jgi:hypothetical protein
VTAPESFPFSTDNFPFPGVKASVALSMRIPKRIFFIVYDF